MDLNTYETITKSESSSRNYVLGFCFKNQQRICPVCRSRKLRKMVDKRYRCLRCRYRFHDLTGRWINSGNLTYGQWLRIIKLFELEVTTRKISKQLRISYNTAYKAINAIRMSILAHSNDSDLLLSGEVEMDESYFGGRRKGNRGRGAANKVPVFGILERNGIVNVEVVPDVKAETLVGLTVKKVKRGSIVYTDQFRSYDSLIFCGYRHLSINHSTDFAKGKVYINGVEGFWSYAKERLIKYHGMSHEKFPLYLKEMEFRYNNRSKDIYPIIVQYLTDYIPGYGGGNGFRKNRE